MSRTVRQLLLLAGLAPLVRGALFAQAGGPGDYDFKLIPEKKIYRQGEEVAVDATVAVRKLGVLGWSYGVEHDEALLEVLSATTVGTDVPGVFLEGFNQTKVITENNVKLGWIQAIVLSLTAERRELPINPRFVMAKARYKVLSAVCGAQADIPTSLVFSGKLAVSPSPPVEISVSVEGNSVEPTVKDPAELTVDCPAPGTQDLLLVAEATEARKLNADKKDVLSIEIRAENEDNADPVDVQGWSYGLKLDPALLEVVDLTTAPDAAALNGGAGPDFRAYNWKPLDESADGKTKGITVGVVISLDPPNESLVVPVHGDKSLEILKVRSAITIDAGQADRTTDLVFVSEVLGGNRPIENIFTVAGLSITPEISAPSVTLTLTAPGVNKLFKRGNSNTDDRLDIADGIWTIRALYYREGQFGCLDAADANDDGRVDLADAIYTFNYLLQPGRTSGNLYPKFPPPYPACGSDPSEDTLGCVNGTKGCN